VAKEYPLFVEPEDLSPCLQKPVWAFALKLTVEIQFNTRHLFTAIQHVYGYACKTVTWYVPTTHILFHQDTATF